LLGGTLGCRSGAGSTAGIGGVGGNGATAGSTTGTAGVGGNGATAGSTASTGVGGDVGSVGGMGGAPADAGSDGPLVGAFVTQTLAIASDYLGWGRVDDELRWAPFLCRQPLPGIARPSQSNDSTTHGQKLYSVFAKHHEAYPNGPYEDQAVVKQSWTAELAAPGATLMPQAYQPEPDAGDHFYPYAQGDGGVYKAAAPAGLFVMFRLDPATPDTDEGWVYATVSPAGEVTSVGRVASCMGCHESATHERLFGVPLSPRL
jgi:hypothetical protein